MEFACVETQIGNGGPADCEVKDFTAERVIIQILD
jgi:hypothetical protein